MIPLPQSLRVKRNEQAEAKLVAKARSWLESEERAPGIHASDLLDPRLAFFNHTDPQPIQEHQVGLFLVGKVLHAFVLGAVAGSVDIGTSDAGSGIGSLGITTSPDYLDGVLAEFKTSRSFYEPQDVEKDLGLYIEQLLIYMADKQVRRSQLWVLYLNHKKDGKTNPQFRCFTITITASDLEELTSYLRERITELDRAISTGEYRGLPLCREWKCSAKQCVYWHKCKPEGRYRQVPGPAKAAEQLPVEVDPVAGEPSEGS